MEGWILYAWTSCNSSVYTGSEFSFPAIWKNITLKGCYVAFIFFHHYVCSLCSYTSEHQKQTVHNDCPTESDIRCTNHNRGHANKCAQFTHTHTGPWNLMRGDLSSTLYYFPVFQPSSNQNQLLINWLAYQPLDPTQTHTSPITLLHRRGFAQGIYTHVYTQSSFLLTKHTVKWFQ